MGYSSFPSRAASLPPSHMQETAAHRAGQLCYHPARSGIQQFSGQGRLTTTQPGGEYSSLPGRPPSLPPGWVVA